MNSLGNLSQCMMDSDPEALARARRVRRKAILISVILEALLLGAMLLWPLITPGVLPPRYILTPLPPYRGGGGAANSNQQTHRLAHTRRPFTDRIHQILFPTALAKSRPHAIASDAPDVAPGPGVPFGIGVDPGSGPGIPFGIVGVHPESSIERPNTSGVRPVRQRISEGVMAGALIHRVEPSYPRIAVAMGLSGIVSLRAVIATDGTVQQLEVLSGHPILARAAVEAVNLWRYRPTLLNGKAVEVETYVTVKFVLSR